ncbi:MAG: DNA primase, partial [Candidatus Omnitrophica bacterium]|nr:DNA primase [Candidatus Omnitrophota bacterium]
KKPFKFRPFCKLLFAMNNMPRIDDKTSALFRRLIILRFERQFKEEEQDRELSYKLEEELDGIFLWSLEGLSRLRARGRFELSEKMHQEIDGYRRQNNNVILFVEEECNVGPSLEISKDSLYREYKEWCESNGYRAFSKINFGRELTDKNPMIHERRSAAERLWHGIGYTVKGQFEYCPHDDPPF